MLAVFGVRVRFWLFRGLAACFTVVCLFYAAVCALCAWFRWFASFICHFIVVLRSPALRLLCAAVSALCPVVFDGVLHFCADRCFSCCFPTLCVFSIVVLFSVAALVFLRQFFFIVDVRFYIFFLSLNVVCCVLFFFQYFCIINWIFSRLDVFIDDDFFSFFAVDCAFLSFFLYAL